MLAAFILHHESIFKVTVVDHILLIWHLAITIINAKAVSCDNGDLLYYIIFADKFIFRMYVTLLYVDMRCAFASQCHMFGGLLL